MNPSRASWQAEREASRPGRRRRTWRYPSASLHLSISPETASFMVGKIADLVDETGLSDLTKGSAAGPPLVREIAKEGIGLLDLRENVTGAHHDRSGPVTKELFELPSRRPSRQSEAATTTLSAEPLLTASRPPSLPSYRP